MLGFGAENKTPQNILRTGQCVVNLPDETMAHHVNNLATTTGIENPSTSKVARGYRYVKDKWFCADLSSQASQFVRPARIRECPVQMECELAASHPLMQDSPDRAGFLLTIELRVLCVHVLDSLRMTGHANRIDPDKWRPMIMSFQQLFGLKDRKLAESDLAKIDEEHYRALTASDDVNVPSDMDKKIRGRGGNSLD